MIAVDTNVVVRFLVRDDQKQAEAAYRRFKHAEVEGERLFVPLAVILETIWVLESAYEKSRSEVLEVIQDMRRMPVFELEKNEVLERLCNDGAKFNADLADILIAHSAESCGCGAGITFDKKAAGLPFFNLLD